jgi:hypothetical protein
MMNINTIRLLVVVMAIISSTAAQAQIKIGVKAGGGLSSITSKHVLMNHDPGFAFHGGLFAQVTRYQSKFYVRPELLFSVKNSTIANGANSNFQANYFSIPIMFGYILTPKVNVLTGIEPAFITSTKNNSFFNASSLSKSDILLNLGVCYHVTYNFGIELRAGVGLFNMLEVTETDVYGNTTNSKIGHQQNLQLSLSYNFAKEGKSNIKPTFR